ncbi:4-hydroxy-3-methylbut-2-en-1-yl diphosphate synthase (flavodoxin) [Fulvitalea axinellae]|uniref:4-hydroxy-3-methylbut-2-en-1-yl diphosphate synthase (flavodoxin) n=1 Tax=Fulvitalea axinellae TaxID=1182444 RepID=A0AAU9CJU8_9BACT|nr:4-hydroxy-3-methylbut-2-en-1-yl diphosphate synthase (flavodoxin) [Fulvitalea axinellae]
MSENNILYCDSLTAYSRRKTVEVNIGGVPMGGDNPIRIQSMTTVDTMDTEGSVAEVLRLVEAGCEYVRLTAPSVKEAENLANIKNELRARGCNVPLVADIHFTPNAAEVAARIVEKVRVNPGNYADKKRFQEIDYTDEEYASELERIREKFAPLVELCKEHGTAMRIGTNHGSLSDRIMSRYGDTPFGMVESALEFIRICEDMDYDQLTVSMKSSNPQVMVQAYRLLVQKLDEEGLKPYPLHLGVTEAGEGEDGRIKSAVGIGTLLEDGLGDTVRVSLTEAPEYEPPVARKLVARYDDRTGHAQVAPVDNAPVDPFRFQRRETVQVADFGGKQVPRVIADMHDVAETGVTNKDLGAVGHHYLSATDKWHLADMAADYVYTGDFPMDFELPSALKEVVDFEAWKGLEDTENRFPLLKASELEGEAPHPELNFILVKASDLSEEIFAKFKNKNNIVLVLETENAHGMAEQRRFFFQLIEKEIKLPVVILRDYADMDEEDLQIHASTEMGALLVDGLGDGVLLRRKTPALDADALRNVLKRHNSVAFGLLQAARMRVTKAEYISCPSCGRTLFDLQETTAMIRKRTDHLKGVKIGIMGCIVNGPGEMADADYGYVGSGKGKITLYRGQEVVKRGVNSEGAVDELINLIREDGNWVEPETSPVV